MRRARWLILAAISIIVFAVGSTYYGRLALLEKDAPSKVQALRAGVDATAERWHFRKNDDKVRGPNGEPCPVAEVTAGSFEQVQQPASYQLKQVELKLFHECGETFDDVVSAKASFDTSSGVLYSDGDVEITMSVKPDEESSSNRLTKIFSSGVNFETKTGKVSTERAASFKFEHGDGKAVGAEYDPNNRQLHMKSQVELNWKGVGPHTVPLKVETTDLIYFEHEGKVALTPWARMTRGALKAEGGNSMVTLEDKAIRQVDTVNARGVQDDNGRKVEYAADNLHMLFNDDGQVSKVNGDGNAHLISTSDTGSTDVKSDHVELNMVANDNESVLDKALAMGHAVVESHPAITEKTPPADTRVLRSEAIELRMRPGGKEIDNVETHAAGSLEFIPNRPVVPHRFLNGDKFWIAYGDNNQIKSFRAIKVTTRTENPPKDGKPVPPVLTSSEELKVAFEPHGNQMERLEQNTNFRYSAGERKAQSDRAILEQKVDRITLIGSARVADPSGTATADRIVMNQKNNDFTAEGHVTSTRLPDPKGGNTSAMLSNSEPTQAKADKLVSSDHNQQLHYEGHAVAWQGANRVQADRIDIDRDDEQMHASGSVISQFVDKPKKPKDAKDEKNAKTAPQPPQQTVYTVVKAQDMLYTEETRLAHYTGGAFLTRPNMTVKGREIRAYLKPADADSSLDHAFADGSVVVVQAIPARTRTGIAEHAEYYAGEEKIIMTGGSPHFIDSLKGTTKGKILTYYPNDDRLLVNGVDSQRVESLLHRK